MHSHLISNTQDVKEVNWFSFDVDQKMVESNPNGLEIMVNQMGERLKFRRRKDPKLEYKPCWFSIFLCRDEADGKSPVTYVKSLVSTNYQIGMQVPESMLKPGKHILKIEALWGKAAKQYQSFCLKLQAK